MWRKENRVEKWGKKVKETKNRFKLNKLFLYTF